MLLQLMETLLWLLRAWRRKNAKPYNPIWTIATQCVVATLIVYSTQSSQGIFHPIWAMLGSLPKHFVLNRMANRQHKWLVSSINCWLEASKAPPCRSPIGLARAWANKPHLGLLFDDCRPWKTVAQWTESEDCRSCSSLNLDLWWILQ